ncbi:MAG TPA: hypothetical protein VFO86_15770, partial [Terriglobia bacterium]|nr:hypothetical protein [Terriglobia bacterium]
ASNSRLQGATMKAGSIALLLLSLFLASGLVVVAETPVTFRVLATTKTSTMEKELNESVDVGFRMDKVMGGDTEFGGSEVVVVMSKKKDAPAVKKYSYKLLATSRTSTMEKELNQAGAEGFNYVDQTVFKTAFAGEEVVAILELNRENQSRIRYEYKLLATSKTSTIQKELQAAGDLGFSFVGVTVGKTAYGGKEVLSILKKEVPWQD